VFIPVNSAQTYHLGRATIQDQADEVGYFNGVHFAERMPIPRYRRKAENRQWRVPYISAVVTTDLDTAAFARECVDRLLNQTETDLHVFLVGPWSTLDGGRRRVLADPSLELYLTQEWYRHEGRVTLVEQAPDDVFPSPYRLDVPVTVGLQSRAVTQMMRSAFGEDIGMANFFPPDGHDASEPVRVTFTAAKSRADRYVSEDVTYVEAMDAVWGVEWKPNLQVGMLDLRTAERNAPIKRSEPQQVENLRARIQRMKAELEAEKEKVARLRRQRAGTDSPEMPAEHQSRRSAGDVARAVRRRLRG
jgi:hypothetical protein